MTTRILYVTTSTSVGGAEKTLYTLATLVNPAAFEVAGVVSLKPKGDYALKLEAAGHRVWTLGVTAVPGLAEVQALAAIIGETSPAIVHAIMYQAIQISRAVKRLGYADYALITSPRVHYRTRSGLSLWVDRLLRSCDDLLVTESEASRKHLVETLGYEPEKVRRVYNGIDVAGWSASKAERRRIRTELRLGARDVLIGAVGRLDEQKGHAYLLEAVAKLRALHPVHCVILGDGPLQATLSDLIVRLRLEDCARLAGEVHDVPAWLSALDIFALPSLWEGLPNALLEAMGMGLPAVATRVDGVGEVVQHDHNGFLCEAGDSQALFTPLQDLLLDAGLRSRLGAAAQKTVAERFTVARMISDYEAIYAQLAEGPR